MKADPNRVPYQDAWTDNIGGMANAIFWLEENWTSNLNAQGDYFREQEDGGGHWFWNYCSITKILLVHRCGTKEWFEITRDKIVHVKNGNEEMADYYRPFVSDIDHSKIEWLKTRHVEVIKSHHPDRIPLYVRAAHENIHHRLKNHPLIQFPAVNLTFLVTRPLPNAGKQRLTLQQLLAYQNLSNLLPALKTADREFLPHHIHSYWALLDALREFELAIDPTTTRAFWDEFCETTILQMIDDVLNQLGDERSAQLLYAMLKKISHESAGTFVRARHEALNPRLIRTN
jgi:hypothetical protein